MLRHRIAPDHELAALRRMCGEWHPVFAERQGFGFQQPVTTRESGKESEQANADRAAEPRIAQ